MAEWLPALQARFEVLHDSPFSLEILSFYLSVSAVCSSKMKGEAIKLDSRIRPKRFGGRILPGYTRKTDNLYDACYLARTLTPENLPTTCCT